MGEQALPDRPSPVVLPLSTREIDLPCDLCARAYNRRDEDASERTLRAYDLLRSDRGNEPVRVKMPLYRFELTEAERGRSSYGARCVRPLI